MIAPHPCTNISSCHTRQRQGRATQLARPDSKPLAWGLSRARAHNPPPQSTDRHTRGRVVEQVPIQQAPIQVRVETLRGHCRGIPALPPLQSSFNLTHPFSCAFHLLWDPRRCRQGSSPKSRPAVGQVILLHSLPIYFLASHDYAGQRGLPRSRPSGRAGHTSWQKVLRRVRLRRRLRRGTGEQVVLDLELQAPVEPVQTAGRQRHTRGRPKEHITTHITNTQQMQARLETSPTAGTQAANGTPEDHTQCHQTNIMYCTSTCIPTRTCALNHTLLLRGDVLMYTALYGVACYSTVGSPMASTPRPSSRPAGS